YQARKQARQFYFQYYKSMFKPRVDFSMFAPSLRENVSPIERADGLPVYNSTGIMQAGGNLKFTYMLPTGGNLSLNSQLYREDLKTVLALKDYETLKSKQANSSLSLNFSQPIFTANTLKENLLEAEYWYEQSSSQFTRGQMDIVFNVTEGFYALYKAIREVEIASEKLENSEEAYRIAKLKGETGKIPEGDVLIAEIGVSQNKAALLSKQGDLEREKDKFIQTIGLDQEEDIQIITDLRYDTYTIDMDKAREEALKNRLEIYEAELDIKLQQIDLEQAKRVKELSGEITAYYDITGVSTTQSNSTGDLFNSSFDNFVDRPPNRGITLTFSYPIFDWGRGSSRVQEEEVTLKEVKLQHENLQRTIAREVKDVVRRMEVAREQLIINEKNQEVAQRSYGISRMRFENGDMTSQELGREQERLAESQLQYLNAFIAYQLATADLKRKTLWDFRNNQSYLIDTNE
ncbi:MAG: TolC family protein, partial [Candidatus Latescibacteria bacterium]|nr:TolC family protein [Candidatus Latescibacterota bacterium]